MTEEPELPLTRRVESIESSFRQFHLEHPEVYDTLEKLCQEWFAFHDRGGIGMFYEVARWELTKHLSTDIGDFKLNNNFRSRFSRMLLAAHPEWVGRLQIRQLRSW